MPARAADGRVQEWLRHVMHIYALQVCECAPSLVLTLCARARRPVCTALGLVLDTRAAFRSSQLQPSQQPLSRLLLCLLRHACAAAEAIDEAVLPFGPLLPQTGVVWPSSCSLCAAEAFAEAVRGAGTPAESRAALLRRMAGKEVPALAAVLSNATHAYNQLCA